MDLESLAVKVRADAATAIDEALQARPEDTVAAAAPAEVAALARVFESAVCVAEGPKSAAATDGNAEGAAAVTRRDEAAQVRRPHSSPCASSSSSQSRCPYSLFAEACGPSSVKMT